MNTAVYAPVDGIYDELGDNGEWRMGTAWLASGGKPAAIWCHPDPSMQPVSKSKTSPQCPHTSRDTKLMFACRFYMFLRTTRQAPDPTYKRITDNTHTSLFSRCQVPTLRQTAA
jgi:hypothetical protein